LIKVRNFTTGILWEGGSNHLAFDHRLVAQASAWCCGYGLWQKRMAQFSIKYFLEAFP